MTGGQEDTRGDLARLSGQARLVSRTVYLDRGVAAAEDTAFEVGGVSVLYTANPLTAISKGLPSPDERPPLSPIFGGTHAPASTPEQRAAGLGKRLTIGSAVCFRSELSIDNLDLSVRWQADAGITMAHGALEAAMDKLRQREARTLLALATARSPNSSNSVERFDGAFTLWSEGDPRPISMVTVTGGRADVWVSEPLERMDRDIASRLVEGPSGLSGFDEGLLRTTFDAKADILARFLAAWAVLERLIAKSHGQHLAALQAADPAKLSAGVLAVQTKLTEQGDLGSSIINQFVALRWSLSPSGVDEDLARFKSVNRLRQDIYHRGQTSEVYAAHQLSTDLILRLYRLATSSAK